MVAEITGEQCLEQISRHRMVLSQQIITRDEFAAKLVDDLVCVDPASLKSCVETLTRMELDAVDKLLEATVRNCDFMPFPSGFLAPVDDIEQTKRELRPRYFAINELILRAKGCNPN